MTKPKTPAAVPAHNKGWITARDAPALLPIFTAIPPSYELDEQGNWCFVYRIASWPGKEGL